MLRKTVFSQTLIFVPAGIGSDLLHTRRKVSCTRSSPADTDPEREIANARKCFISVVRLSLKTSGGGALASRIGELLARQTMDECSMFACMIELGIGWRGAPPAKVSS
jgi:hypothetical protein